MRNPEKKSSETISFINNRVTFPSKVSYFLGYFDKINKKIYPEIKTI